jgi:hypothetical protein
MQNFVLAKISFCGVGEGGVGHKFSSSVDGFLSKDKSTLTPCQNLTLAETKQGVLGRTCVADFVSNALSYMVRRAEATDFFY